ASANFLGYLIGALLTALFPTRMSKRSWLILSLFLSALTTASMGLTTSLLLFIVIRFVGGLASAVMLVFGSALVLDRLAAAGRPGFSALHFGGVGLGITLSAVIVASYAATGSGWENLWLASGIISLVLLLGVMGMIPASPEKPFESKDLETGGLNSLLLRLIVAYGLFGFGYVITATFISTIVRDSPALQPVEPVVWTAVGLAAIPSVYFWSRVGQKLGNDRSFALACLVEAIGVTLTVTSENTLLLVTGAVFLGGTFMGITALGLIEARRLSRGDPRKVLGWMTLAFGTGQMIGPLFAGFLFQLTQSLFLPSLVATGCLVIAAILSFKLQYS
ncbi:MAG: YbfB/YjiJ family MFS transporter, partial [Methyloligellaceae bacterium]